MKFKSKFSALLIVVLASVSLSISSFLEPSIGILERSSVATSNYDKNLNVDNSYSFPKFIPLGGSKGESEIYLWSTHNDEYIRFVFYSKFFGSDVSGPSAWQRDSVEVYISDINNMEVFYQIIIPFEGDLKYIKYNGGVWKDRNKFGNHIITKSTQVELPWLYTDKIITDVRENVIILNIPFEVLNIQPEYMIIQSIHNIDGGKNRFISSIHPTTKNEQDRRGWLKLQTDK